MRWSTGGSWVLDAPRALVIGLVAAVVFALPSAAFAAPPLRLDAGLVTDDARVLGDGLSDVEDALERLDDETDVQLFVVLVESFDGMDAQDWTHETASINGLGANDILIAIAVEDRQYAWSVDEDFPLSDADLDRVAAQDIEPRLSDDDWAGAIIAAADGYREALTGGGPAVLPGDVEPVESDGGGGGGSGIWCCAIPGVLLAGVGALIAFLFKRRKKGSRPTASAGTPPAEMSTKDLETTAGQLLVGVDDAIRVSEQELGFAEAEFGAPAIEEYTAALKQSKTEVAEAFRIHQELYDSEMEDDPTRRRMLQRIIELAGGADARLNEKAEGFTRLRDLAGRADEVLTKATQRLDTIEAGLPAASEELAALRTAYLPAALGDVADDDAEATALVKTARAAVAEGAAARAAGDRNKAALAVRTAEDATATAERLLQAISEAGTQLAAARTALTDEADRLEATAAAAEAKDAARYAALVASARGVIASARAALAAPPLDPNLHLGKVREVAVQLDGVLAEAREETQRIEAARVSANGAISTARDRIASAESYVMTRMASVGAQARASLAEATSRLQHAQQVVATDPTTALAEAQSAQQYAESALRYAQGDVASRGGGFPATGMPTSFGGSGVSWPRATPPAASTGGFSGSSSRRSGGGFFSGGSRSSGSSFSRSSSSSSSRSSSSSSSRSSGGRRGGGGRF